MVKNSTICFFNSTKTWGGGEKWHYEMASYLHKKGHKVLVIVCPNSVLSEKLMKASIPIEEIKVSKLSYLKSNKVKKIISFYKKHQVGTVVLNSSNDMKLGGKAAKKVKLSRIIYRRGSAIPIKNSFINRYFFRKVLTEVLANSEATKRTINAKNTNLFSREKITVIPNGVNIKEFDEKPFDKLYIKEKKEFVLGNLGRMVYQKNQEFLIDIALELKKRNLDFKILIGGNGKLETVLKNKIEKYGVQNNIKLLGFIENPKSFMNSVDVFLLPSRWEGFGYVLTESMLCNKPVVAFDISSNSQIVESEENGFLVPFNDVGAFCDKIIFFYKNPKELKSMGERGRKKIENEFDSIDIQEKVKKYLTT